MKILQIIPYPPTYLGGSEIFCKNLSINLKKRHNIDNVILTSDIYKRALKTSIISDSIKVIYKRFYFNLWGINPIVNILNYIKKNYKKFDIIHAHSYIFLTTLQTSILKKILKFPLVLHIHGGIQTTPVLESTFSEKVLLFSKRNFFDKIIGKYVIESADTIISVSKTDLIFIENMYKISKKKKIWIPNAVEISKFNYDSKVKREYITFIGRLSYIKGIDIYLKIITKLHQLNNKLKFLIIGNGPLKYLVDEAKTKIPITHFTHYPYEKIQEIYKISKVLLLTSRYEGLPTTILESLASKTPVIAPKVGGITEVIINNKTGILYDLNNYNNVISEIINLLDNPTKLKVLGSNGLNLVKKRFSWKYVTKEIKKVYEELLNLT